MLTNSDANSGRIILPRIYVEANLSFVIGYRCVAIILKGVGVAPSCVVPCAKLGWFGATDLPRPLGLVHCCNKL